MAAFYEPSSFGNGHLVIAVDRPCLLLARQTPTAFDLAVSNPENRPLKVTVDVSLQLEGGVPVDARPRRFAQSRSICRPAKMPARAWCGT